MNNTDKIVFGVVAVFTIAIFGFIISSSLKSNAIEMKSSELKSETPNIKGNPDAKVTLVEFSDFQCPACRTFYPFVQDIAEKYSDDINIIYRHFPLPMHNRAIPAARAAEAAAMQNKFWEYHDELFDNFEAYTDEDLLRYAEKLGLDVEKFKQDLNSDAVVKSVNEDSKAAETLSISGTPTFYLIVKDEIRPITINQYADLEEAVKKAVEEVKL